MSSKLSRRTLLLASLGLGAVSAMPALAQGVVVRVAKDPNCGCCSDWIDILREAGFTVEPQDMEPGQLADLKAKAGITAGMRSCHTGMVSGYVLEGHVPVADIRRLLADTPDAIGLAVPGMPMGSPGMGPEEAREPYDVHLLLKDGTSRVFASYGAA